MKKRMKIILIVIALIVLIGTIFAITDYSRIANEKKPIFAWDTKCKCGSELKEYQGLWYKIVIADSMEKPVFLPFGLGTYAWFVGEENETKSIGTADYLFSLKTQRDNSAVGRLLDALDIRMYGQYTFDTFENQATKERLYALIINYTLIEAWGPISNETMIEKSAILLALIDNVDEIHWALPDTNSIDIPKITTSDLLDKYGNIKEYGKSAEDLKLLLIKLGYYEEDDPITMSINNLTTSGLTLTFKNHTNNSYQYGACWSLERKENGKWVEVKQIRDNCAFTAIGYNLKDNQTVEEKIDWKYCYGKLSAGQYRITKDFDDTSYNAELKSGKRYIISAEFLIK